MLLSGSLREMKMLIERTLMVDCEYINFLAPNHVVLIHQTGDEYSYFKTSLFISDSVVLNKKAFLNLHKFLRVAKYSQDRNPSSAFHNMVGETIEVTEKTIRFDHDDDFLFDIETNAVALGVDSPMLKRIGMFSTMINPERMYLKLKPIILKNLQKAIKLADLASIKEDNHVNLNRIFMEGDALAIDKYTKKEVIRYYHTQVDTRFANSDFAIMKNSHLKSIRIYDMDILTLNKICKVRPIESIIIIPYDSFYFVEGHTEEQMICQFRMKTPAFLEKA